MGNITDELREWAKTLTHWWYDPVEDEYTYTTGIMPPSIDAIRLDSNIIAIADRIDANFKAACESEYAAGVMSVPIAVDESKWVRLPVDADGVPIRVGDVVAYEDNTRPKEVVALVPPSVIMVEDGPRFADCCRHHRAQTVEDVLAEFANRVCNSGHQWGLDADIAIAEYAKKLQLKEGE